MAGTVRRQGPTITVSGEVAAVDRLYHADEPVGVRRPRKHRHPLHGCGQLVTPQEFGGSVEDNAGVGREASSMGERLCAQVLTKRLGVLSSDLCRRRRPRARRAERDFAQLLAVFVIPSLHPSKLAALPDSLADFKQPARPVSWPMRFCNNFAM